MLVLAHVVSVLALLSISALLGGALYDAIVLAPNLRDGAVTLDHGRLFMRVATPASLFRRIGPAAQLLALLTMITQWGTPSRWAAAAALVGLVVADVITLRYHYPRNRLLFTAPLDESAQALARAAREWSAANWLRVALVLVAWFGVLHTVLHSGM